MKRRWNSISLVLCQGILLQSTCNVAASSFSGGGGSLGGSYISNAGPGSTGFLPAIPNYGGDRLQITQPAGNLSSFLSGGTLP